MKDTLSWETRKALEEAEESSDRARRVLTILLVTSILVFMAAWNSRYYGWLQLRLRAAEQKEKTEKARTRAQNPPEATVPPEGRQAASAFDTIQRLAAERSRFVLVPTLGFGFDVNDLAIIAGVSFVLLLVWLHFSIGRERLNVLELFRRARADGSLRDAYELLAMTQVLSTPPNLKVEFAGSGWGGATKYLFWIPLGVQAFVVVHDLATYDRAHALSPDWSIATMALGTGLGLLMIKITRDCWRFSHDLQNDWAAVFDEVYKSPQLFITELSRDATGRVTHIRNRQAGWDMPVEAAITMIEAGDAVFYAIDPRSGSRLRVGVRQSHGRNELFSEVPSTWQSIPI
jgi:hypothetical protein